MNHTGSITSKINATPIGLDLPVSKVHFILLIANLLDHNNIDQICYRSQISLQSAAVNCSFSENLTFRSNISFAGNGAFVKPQVVYYSTCFAIAHQIIQYHFSPLHTVAKLFSNC